MPRFDDTRHDRACAAVDYLSRPAERLVVEGYRSSLSGCAERDPKAWAAAWMLYQNELGEIDGRIAFDGLVGLIGTLGRCATCPLRFFRRDISHLCRDEGLLLALVAAAQHGDEQTGQIAAEALSCPAKCGELAMAAAEYGFRLRMVGRTLLPISASFTASIADKKAQPARDDRPVAATLH
ncbi:hypothetical protein [Notoacmeibacter ruber]|uniref:Uncharacterized protein n=1 Tax=Notoacmeibacter ruber TaxID=2670375 RepID=A0A3L7J9D6_9HYPH|nr:hypothetical protein [Notoacmeibacter ruber]RLQ87226.1 hypothetical protein D8780_02370 [Notoacmeibacter ruber]